MNLFPKSGFEIVHPSAGQLVVIAHPSYGWALFALAILMGVYVTARSNKSDLGLGLFLLGLGILIISSLLSHGKAVFDKQVGRVTFDRVGFLFRPSHASFPLNEIRYATVEPSRGSSRFIVIFKGGGIEGITSSSDASGQRHAADVVNEFLGVGPGL